MHGLTTDAVTHRRASRRCELILDRTLNVDVTDWHHAWKPSLATKAVPGEEAATREGGGTVFTIELPRDVSAA